MSEQTTSVSPAKKHPLRRDVPRPPEPANDDPLFDTVGAAAFLNLSPKTIEKDRCVPSLKLPYVKMGRAVRYRRSDLLAYLQRSRVDPSCPVA